MTLSHLFASHLTLGTGKGRADEHEDGDRGETFGEIVRNPAGKPAEVSVFFPIFVRPLFWFFFSFLTLLIFFCAVGEGEWESNLFEGEAQGESVDNAGLKTYGSKCFFFNFHSSFLLFCPLF